MKGHSSMNKIQKQLKLRFLTLWYRYQRLSSFQISLIILLLIIILLFLIKSRHHESNSNKDELVNFYKLQIVELNNEIKRTEKLKRKCSQIHPMPELCEPKGLGDTFIRDLYSYECKNIVRFGSNDLDPMFRRDGAYFLCFDGNLRPVKSDCVVLSFGINDDYHFDESINKELDCIVHSMDPFTEPIMIKEIRANNKSLNDSVTIVLNSKWMFHSIGITNNERRKNERSIGWLETYDRILEYLNLTNKVIDMLKMDVEGAEYESLPYILDKNPDLLCKYVKQLAFETHPWLYSHTHNYLLLQRLEKCFRLFKRDQRFFTMINALNEWQINSSTIQLDNFKSEIDLARYVFIYGELYFININFI